MLQRMHDAKTTCEELKGFYAGTHFTLSNLLLLR
jgi:hypothetical protein